MSQLAPSSDIAVVAAPKLRLIAERGADLAQVEALMDTAFGPGRYAKTAERLREGNRVRADLSFCAWSGGELVGAVRVWPIVIGAAPAVFLGPIAVDPAWRRRGLGALLVERACEAAGKAGDPLVLLVGDALFFEPLGFQRVPPGRVILPGPVDLRRLLWRASSPEALDGVAGLARVLKSGS